MIFIPLIFIALLFVVAPRFTGAVIVAPIVGSLAGLFFWGMTALCTQSVRNVDSFVTFILVTIGLSVFAFIFDD